MRKHLTYANVMATLAVVLVVAGVLVAQGSGAREVMFEGAFISDAFSFASVYESLTSFEPPLQPNTMQITTTAKTTLKAVVISCWPME